MIPLERLPIPNSKSNRLSRVSFTAHKCQSVIYLSEIDSKHVSLSYFKITQIAFNNDIFLFVFTIESSDWKITGFTRNWFVLFCRDWDEGIDCCSQAPCGWALVRLICMKIVTKILTIRLSHGSKSVSTSKHRENDARFDRFRGTPQRYKD